MDDNVIHLKPKVLKPKEPDQKELAVLFNDIADFAERVLQGPSFQAQPLPKRHPYKSTPFSEIRKGLAESLGQEGAAKLNISIRQTVKDMKSAHPMPPQKMRSSTMIMVGATVMLLDLLARHKTDINLAATARDVFSRINPEAPDLGLDQKVALLKQIRAARLADLLVSKP